MALWTRTSRIEQLASFTGICGFIGAVSDLLTPVGNYTLLCLAGGAAIFVVGLVLLRVRGITSEATKGTLAFGGLLSAVSVAFLVMSPAPETGNSNGALASKFGWIADVQESLLGLSRQVEQIAEDTREIARATDQIARHTEGAFNLSFSRDNFTRALDAEDATNIVMHCERGYRADKFLLLTTDRRRMYSDRNFGQLHELECFDKAALCEPESLRYHVALLDDERVEAVCGGAAVAMINEERAAAPQRDAAREDNREAEYRKCLGEAGNDFVEQSSCAARYSGR